MDLAEHEEHYGAEIEGEDLGAKFGGGHFRKPVNETRRKYRRKSQSASRSQSPEQTHEAEGGKARFSDNGDSQRLKGTAGKSGGGDKQQRTPASSGATNSLAAPDGDRSRRDPHRQNPTQRDRSPSRQSNKREERSSGYMNESKFDSARDASGRREHSRGSWTAGQDIRDQVSDRKSRGGHKERGTSTRNDDNTEGRRRRETERHWSGSYDNQSRSERGREYDGYETGRSKESGYSRQREGGRAGGFKDDACRREGTWGESSRHREGVRQSVEKNNQSEDHARSKYADAEIRKKKEESSDGPGQVSEKGSQLPQVHKQSGTHSGSADHAAQEKERRIKRKELEDDEDHLSERQQARYGDESNEEEAGTKPAVEGHEITLRKGGGASDDNDTGVGKAALQGFAAASDAAVAVPPTAPAADTSGKPNAPTEPQGAVVQEGQGKVRASKASKWGPPAEQPHPVPAVPSFESLQGMPSFQTPAPQLAALLAARKAAELVNASMGVSGSMTADEKKKLLWGSKKAVIAEEPVAAAGVNRWDTVHFGDRGRDEKFQKLMGVKADGEAGPASSQVERPADSGPRAFAEQKQRELQEDLERQFAVGLRRRDGRTVGLGL